MNKIAVGQENSLPIELYYEDHGTGKPVVLIHGWPLDGHSWEKQTAALLGAGHRVITYDRRGFGQSSQPSIGYDYDTLAQDLNKLVTQLNLHDVALVGFSMGTGEVARYLGNHGAQRVRKAVFVSGITPCLLKTSDNPTGVDGGVFEGIRQAIAADRPAFLAKFLEDFYNTDQLLPKKISKEAVQASWTVAVKASGRATQACVTAWTTDFRRDLPKITVPSLVIHGDADRITPINATGIPMSKGLKGATLKVLKDAPHGCLLTHAEEVNRELVDFLR
jgi:non-heme chloroperoxidase